MATATKKSAASKKSVAKKAAPAKKSAPAKKAAPKKSAMPSRGKSAMPSRGNAAGKSAMTSRGMQQQNDSNMLYEFFCDELKDIYWAEKHLVKTLPKMKKAATSPQLQQAFDEHLSVTQTHVERLEQIFEMLGKKAQAKKCDAMAGITEEGAGIIEETEKGTSTRDVGLILAGQKVEHYEIATYGGLAQLARTLGKDDVAEILEATLAEEKEADSLLTEIAENDINYEASTEDEEEEEDDEDEEEEDEDEE
jgi:ferritin-like metal-binding protein YciE